MNITSILRLQTLVVFIGLGLISSEIAASKTADKSVYIAPKLSQSPDFEAFTLIASQGHGRSLVRILPEKSYYQHGLVLPASSMHMTGAVIDSEKLAKNELEHPNKVGQLDRPIFVVGGRLKGFNHLLPQVDFMQLRLPYVQLKEQQQSVQSFIVKVSIIGGKYGISHSHNMISSLPTRTYTRVPWRFGYRLPKGLPDHKTSHLLDFELRLSSGSRAFANELLHALEHKGAINISVYEKPARNDITPDDGQLGEHLYDINYAFKDDPHEVAKKHLHAIISASVDDLINGKGRIAGEI
ncbi:MAG: hypothetical protein C0509_07195 [Acinetobacter sp.]|nr:hypothetical protein [Acinetobacter sp.]